MAPPRKPSNGRSPLVNPQKQITSFFSKTTSPSPSPSPTLSKKQTPKSNLNPNPPRSPSPSPSTPSPVQSKPNKPLLVIGHTPSPSPSPSTPATTDRLYGKEVVGKRIRVYWPLDKCWYEGCVKSLDEKTGKHLVQYDDSEEEMLDLRKEKIEWIEDTVQKFKRLRKGALAFKRSTVIEDEMEDGSDGADVDNNDDSSDEDWVNNVKEEPGEGVEEALVEEVEDEEEAEVEEEEEHHKKVKLTGKGTSRKRKASGVVKVDSVKKSKSTVNVSKGSSKVQPVGPVKNKESK